MMAFLPIKIMAQGVVSHNSRFDRGVILGGNNYGTAGCEALPLRYHHRKERDRDRRCCVGNMIWMVFQPTAPARNFVVFRICFLKYHITHVQILAICTYNVKTFCKYIFCSTKSTRYWQYEYRQNGK